MTAPEEQQGGPARSGDWTRRGVLAGLVGAPVLLLAACNDGKGSATGGATTTTPRTSAAVITVSPADGAQDAAFTEPVRVAVAEGRLRSVAVTDDTGRAVAGELAPDGAGWTSTGPLASGTKYTVAVVAVDKSRLEADSNTAFATTSPADTFVGIFTPEDGSTVGVGMPISILFTKPVTNRRAVQRAVTVVAEPDVEVVGHWFSSTRLDFRPERYWAKGTKVTLKLRLKDVEGAKGVYGTQHKNVSFTIGRSQVSVADLATDILTVTTDGQVSARYPILGGAPDHRTWGGTMVITEQYVQTRMNSTTVGLGNEYDIADVPHAQRLTTSGTFIHGNYWAPPSAFGKENLSHGCIGLQDVQGAGDPGTNAARFYAGSLVGDVVEVVNSGDRTVDPANGLNGWNLSWADWRAGSALD